VLVTCINPLCLKHVKYFKENVYLTFDMQFSAFKKERADNLPPNLDAGVTLAKIARIEPNTFKLNGQDTKGMRVFAIPVGQTEEKEFRTSSGVIMKQLEEFFSAHPNDAIENVKVVAPRGKQYLTLEEA
jgi:hypothetical protein